MMLDEGNSRRIKTAAAAGIVFLAFFAALTVWWTNRVDLPDASSPEAAGLAFFGVGATSVLSHSLQGELEDILGESAIEGWSPVDLSVGGKAYAPDTFPDLAMLNSRLKVKGGTLAGNGTWKLVFRYAPHNKLPFAYVKMVFDKESEHPLFIQIRSVPGKTGFLESIEEKFGPPRRVKNLGRALDTKVWQEQENLLIAAEVPNKIDVIEWHLYIYFKKNIQELADRIEAEMKSNSASEPSAF